MTDAPEYIHYDYSAINNHIDGIQSHLKESERARKAQTFATYAKYTAVVMVAIGILCLLLAWGWSLIKEPRIVKDIKIVEKPVTYRPIVNVNTTGAEASVREEALARLSESKSSSNATAGNSVYDFVIFRSIPFNQGGIKNITVGMRYADQNSKQPSSQWCYVEKEGKAYSAFSKNTSLSRMFGSKKIDAKLTLEDALSMGVDLSVLRSAQSKCLFK